MQEWMVYVMRDIGVEATCHADKQEARVQYDRVRYDSEHVIAVFLYHPDGPVEAFALLRKG